MCRRQIVSNLQGCTTVKLAIFFAEIGQSLVNNSANLRSILCTWLDMFSLNQPFTCFKFIKSSAYKRVTFFHRGDVNLIRSSEMNFFKKKIMHLPNSTCKCIVPCPGEAAFKIPQWIIWVFANTSSIYSFYPFPFSFSTNESSVVSRYSRTHYPRDENEDLSSSFTSFRCANFLHFGN